MNLIAGINPIADQFQQQAAEISAILANPDIRLTDEEQCRRFAELAITATMNLRRLRDLVSLSAYNERNLTLVQLAERLERHPADAPVRFDIGGEPTQIFYAYPVGNAHIALGKYSPWHPIPLPNTGQLAKAARNTPNEVHAPTRGYAVNLYNESPVWMAEYDEFPGRMIVDVQADDQGCVVLVTEEPDWLTQPDDLVPEEPDRVTQPDD